VQLNECPEKSAMREAMEEGGVVGVLGRYLGVFDNLERRHRTRVYVLRVSQLVVSGVLFQSPMHLCMVLPTAFNSTVRVNLRFEVGPQDFRPTMWPSVLQ
jgi:ADP-ribose pyrophosphatase YjhB (NUDIX family)